jgi:hypothetical protein
MPEFEESKRHYAAMRAAEEAARLRLSQAVEKVKRLQRERESQARRVRADGDASRAPSRSALERELNAAREEAERLRGAFVAARESTARANLDFAEFTDPARSVQRLPDDVPIALFPLRLETRFKTIRRQEATQRVLCVRVFPDDVLIDSFQNQIGQAELDNVTIYWTQRWRAGGNPAGHRAAWATLVKIAGSGRAKWLTEQVAPLNPQAEPSIAAGEHVLVIRPPAPIADPEQKSIAKFWTRMWSTAGAERGQAFADLATDVGAARAAEIEARLEPVNLRDVAVKPSPSIKPVVAFLNLPDPATLPLAQDVWTRGARAWLLPERLVLLGFLNQQQVLARLGEPIPADLPVGPDPGASDAEQIKADGPDLQIPDALRWTVDFDEAVAKGMGFRVNLTELGLEPTFDRLFVLGVRLGSDADKGAAELADLIAHHQASRKGFSLLPQGRPTNNTEESTAGYTWWEDPDDSFRHYFETNPSDDPTSWQRRKDGAWLAGMLGLPPALLRKSTNYYGTDQTEARAMNVALWPATLGYYMEQMLEPVFSEQTVRDTRAFFNRFVIGRGTIPLVRIGRQPYGILPATVWSKMSWWTQAPYARTARVVDLPSPQYLAALYQLTNRAVDIWRELAKSVSHVGKPGADRHKTLLKIVGLHPTSAEFYQRFSQSFTQYYNALGFATEPVSGPLSAAERRYMEAGLVALAELGWKPPPGTPLPELLEKVFLKKPILLNGELVDAELSDKKRLSISRADGRNYIDWLQWAARTSHDTLRKQEGFADGVPTALLYLYLHHALDLGYIETDLDFRREALQMSDLVYKAQRKEPKFIHIAEGDHHSRWESLYRPEPAVTKDAALRMGDYIPTVLLTRDPYLNTQLSALDTLKVATTGALERALVEHLDCLTYRMDAWRLGIQAVQLAHMRGESEAGFGKGGIYVGAYGWLEHVHAKSQTLEPVRLDDELAGIFARTDDPPLVRDASNFGHIHAPSLDQAVTAAILRNGHLANATPKAPDLLAVDISSERVRWAQQIIEGIRNGQSLGALLGYRLERSLHDEPTIFLDKLIYEFRRAFPLAGNRNQLTRNDDLDAGEITKVEARNVVDGALFVDHIAKTGKTTYPYGLSGLPALSALTQPGSPSAAVIGALVDRCVTDMRRVADAVADLAIAEGVYQLVRGNYDRAAGTLDAFSKGTHPPLPEVASTPRNGNTLTHRIALHLQGGLLPSDPGNTRPRSKGEPALAKWLNAQMPEPATVFAKVKWRNESAETEGALTPSMADLSLSRADLFYMLDAGGARDMPGFDDLLIDYAEQNGAPPPRHDAVFTLEYKAAGVAGLTLFELAPLVRALRGLILGARSLRPTDLALQNEAASAEDSGFIIRTDKVQAVLNGLQGTLAAVTAFIANLEAAIGQAVNPQAARDAARDNIDAWIGAYANAVRPVTPFGLQAASLTTAVEGRRPRFHALLTAIDEVIERWKEKQDDYDAVMNAYAALPGTATDEERTTLLIRAGRIVSTVVIAPLPVTIAALENNVALLRGNLDSKLANLIALRDNATQVGATLSAVTGFLAAMDTIDQTPFEVATFRDSVLALANDLLQKATFLRDDINRRVASAADALTRAAAASGDKAHAAAVEAAKAILGDAFILLPEFKLSNDRLAEWNNVWTNRAKLLTHLTLGPEATPFPLDDWLHGVARVRERLRNLELTTVLGETLGATKPPVLEALQFPHRPNDSWLGMRFPATFSDGKPFVLQEDKLLYSAHFAAGAEIHPVQPNATYSGLLLDEWVEVIPTEHANTGLSFHFDRPNSEAPQAILLATPPMHRGAWQWQDIVDTLHEALDFARMRAVEPEQLDDTALGFVLPAVLSSVTAFPITAALNLGFNNIVHVALAEGVQ